MPAALPAAPGGRRADLLAAGAAALLVTAAAVIGTVIEDRYGTLHVQWPPLLAEWMPHTGPGTLPAFVVAVLVVLYGPALAARLSWRRLLATSWAAALAWTWSLALVDGWQRGVAGRLDTVHEYLRGVDRFHDIHAALRGYTAHILLDSPDNWPTHIAGHPPAAVLTFVGLDRVGLGGGAWAATFCILTGTSTVVAVLVTLRALDAERAARAAAPFLVLTPAAVWVGASADAYFAAVGAWALALLTLSATRATRAPRTAALAAGLLLGWIVYLSYGLTLMVVPVAAILLLTRTARPLPLVALGFLAVAVTFTLAGFRWWDAYELLVQRYYQGVAKERPYAYWVWGNLANVVIAAGLASAAGIRRAFAATPDALGRLRPRRGGVVTGDGAVVLLVVALLLAVAAADLSGMSKAETERIWLPFTLWLPVTAALLPARDHRRWLLAQAAVGLAVNHLLLTFW
ncbi:hypothetical protein [Streptomyces liangshanensis]|uniref:Integral membrane protein n=1 Tax=Streptomyces liangshanensis TaxID=2717324 RepID=A0A6G9H925_9ACTN|nr:hypothetical protein [Streptomyces liangshanensis]QIQ06711.1 hypothetical protein HA039_05130 [Streptomyces liangshanensis]